VKAAHLPFDNVISNIILQNPHIITDHRVGDQHFTHYIITQKLKPFKTFKLYDTLKTPFLVSMVAACFIKKIIDIAETKNVKVDSLVAEVGAFARPEDVINGVARLSKFKILVKTTVDIPEDIINEAKKKCAAYSTLSTCVDFEVTFIKVSTLT